MLSISKVADFCCLTWSTRLLSGRNLKVGFGDFDADVDVDLMGARRAGVYVQTRTDSDAEARAVRENAAGVAFTEARAAKRTAAERLVDEERGRRFHMEEARRAALQQLFE